MMRALLEDGSALVLGEIPPLGRLSDRDEGCASGFDPPERGLNGLEPLVLPAGDVSARCWSLRAGSTRHHPMKQPPPAMTPL